MLHVAPSEPAQDRLRVGGALRHGGHVAHELVVLLLNQRPVDLPRQDAGQVGVGRDIPGLGQVEPLTRNAFQTRQELEAKHPAERERHLALAVAVHILALDLHLRVMAQHALDHGGHLRRRAAPQA